MSESFLEWQANVRVITLHFARVACGLTPLYIYDLTMDALRSSQNSSQNLQLDNLVKLSRPEIQALCRVSRPLRPSMPSSPMQATSTG